MDNSRRVRSMLKVLFDTTGAIRTAIIGAPYGSAETKGATQPRTGATTPLTIRSVQRLDRRRHFVLVLVVALAASGCTVSASSETVQSSVPPPGQSTTPSINPSSGSVGQSTEAPDSRSDGALIEEADDEPPRSPIETALPYMRLTSEQIQNLTIALQRQYEEDLAVCMRREGFDYIQVDVTQPALLGVPEGMPETDDEFRDRYGFGVALNARLAFEPIISTFIDPNVEIVEALDQAGRDAYNDQLGTCHRQLQETTTSPLDPPRQSEGEQASLELWLIEQLGALDQAIAKDSRITAAVDQWSRCMANEGFDFASPGQAIQHVDSEAVPILERVYEGLTDELDHALEDLQDYELQVSDAGRRCATEVKLDDIMQTVRFEMETEFLEENGDRVALLAAEKNALLEEYRHILDQ